MLNRSGCGLIIESPKLPMSREGRFGRPTWVVERAETALSHGSAAHRRSRWAAEPGKTWLLQARMILM